MIRITAIFAPRALGFASLVALGIALAPRAAVPYCKWVDETGCVHYAETCPEGVQAEDVEVAGDRCLEDPEAAPPAAPSGEAPAEMKDEAQEQAPGQASFVPVTNTLQLWGCWERIWPPAESTPNPNRIEIYPFEEPRYQYFCFESRDRLYTYMTTRQPDLSPRALKKQATALPSVERYTLARPGLVLIEHLDAHSRYYWVTRLAEVAEAEAVPGMRTGDVLMSLVHARTGETLYVRHLRRID